MWNRDHKHGLKLYVQRVFIMDDAEQFMPNYLRFVRGLLYIPSQAPWDMWNRDHKHGLKLYVQRVFIMDDAEQFMPNYLRFVRGLIDSSDLPLNVSREILQDSTVTRNLSAAERFP